MTTTWKMCLGLLALITAVTTSLPANAQQQQKPNIVIIWGDDIGISDVSAYSHGLMGFKTPNIDRIASEGHDIHRLLWRAKLHRRPGLVHYRPVRFAHRDD